MGMLYEYVGFHATNCDEDCNCCKGRQEEIYSHEGKLVSTICSLKQERAKKEFLKQEYGI